jgi:phthiocerol/phenolphthiocerol synthesis type-I polyketide synthase D
MSAAAPLAFSLMFFAANEEVLGGQRYDLIVECARFADRHGFAAVWVPERHFTDFGCLYPNPAVLHAALARETTRVALRAGSVVVPLHDPLRIAEEWAMVDNLSDGRVGISAASGWNPDDFAFYPDRFAERHEAMERGVATLRRLWAGEPVEVSNGIGRRVQVRVQPRPRQPELPLWITAAGNPRTFSRAGELGANLLTHLLDHDVDRIAERIALYRRGRATQGHDPDGGEVTVMLHTFVGSDLDAVREEAREPTCRWLEANIGLLGSLAAGRGERIDLAALSADDREQFVGFLFERFFASRSLMGTPRSCLPLLERLAAVGVTEVACLLDFGPRSEQVLRHLPDLQEMKELYRGGGLPPPARSTPPAAPAPDTPAAIRARCTQELAGEELYRALDRSGVQLGPSFQGVQRVWRRDGEALGLVGPVAGEPADGEVPPAFLDACFQVLAAALPAGTVGPAEERRLLLPAGVGHFSLLAPVPPHVFSHAVIRPGPGPDADRFEGDVRILDEAGQLVAEATAFRLQRVASALLGDSGRPTAAGLLYELRWQERSPERPAAAPAGSWLILGDVGGVGERVAARLRRRGREVIALPARAARLADGGSTVGRALAAIPGGPLTVLHLGSLDATPSERTSAASLLADQEHGAASVVATVQALARPGVAGDRALWVVTRGAQAVAGMQPLAIAQAPAWGVGRTCAAEHPELWGGAVDLDPADGPEEAAERLLEAVLAGDGEDQVAVRGGRRYAARLVPLPAGSADPPGIGPDGAYLVTGGLQGVGLEIAAWLVRRGARHLVLLGRTPVPPRQSWSDVDPASPSGRRITAIRRLEAAGATVEHPLVDVADERRLAAWAEARRRQGRPPVRGVVHAASTWRDGEGRILFRPIAKTDAAGFHAALPAKLVGGWLLGRLANEGAVDFVVLLSSAAAIVGSPGQASYAAANAFLDTLGHELTRRGQRALAVQLGPVTQVGFDTTPEGRTFHRIWERRGVQGIAPREVLEALDVLLARDRPAAAVMKLDWPALRRSYAQLLDAPWASALTPVEQAGPDLDLVGRLRGAPPGRRRELLAGELQRLVAMVMGFGPSEAPRADQGFFDIGMDSILALELRAQVQRKVGGEFPVTAVFDHPTIGALAGYLLREVLGLSEQEGPEPGRVPAAAGLLDAVEHLADDEVDRRLAETLEREDG